MSQVLPARRATLSSQAALATAGWSSGKRRRAACWDVIRLWAPVKVEQAAQLGAETRPVVSLAFNPAGNQVLSASLDGTVKVFSVPVVTAKGLFSHAGAVTSAVLSPDGARLPT